MFRGFPITADFWQYSFNATYPPKDFLPDGRASKYRKSFDDLAFKYTLLGATDKEMADFFGISEKTINTWKQKHPEFLQSITRWKDSADSNVAERLYQKAMGYEHDEEKIFQYEGKPVRVATIKHYPPDTQAASLWLRNRQPEKWRDLKDLNVHKAKEPLPTAKEVLAELKELDEELALATAASSHPSEAT